MVDLVDMKSMIQEWMAQPLSAVDLAKLYAELHQELELQLDFCMGQFTKGADHDAK